MFLWEVINSLQLVDLCTPDRQLCYCILPCPSKGELTLSQQPLHQTNMHCYSCSRFAPAFNVPGSRRDFGVEHIHPDSALHGIFECLTPEGLQGHKDRTYQACTVFLLNVCINLCKTEEQGTYHTSMLFRGSELSHSCTCTPRFSHSVPAILRSAAAICSSY